MVCSVQGLRKAKLINWNQVDNIIKKDINQAKNYLNGITGESQ